MPRENLRTDTPEFRAEAVKPVLGQGLSLEEARQRQAIPKGTLGNWVSAAKRSPTTASAPGSRSVAELEAEHARLRRELTLRCKQKRKFKATTNSTHDLPVADHLLNQTFAPTRPNKARVTDITYVPTQEGWLYLAGVKDVFTCEIAGYEMGERMPQALTATALWRAVCNKHPPAGCSIIPTAAASIARMITASCSISLA